MAELQTINYVQWNGCASQLDSVTKLCESKGKSVKSINFSDENLVIELRGNGQIDFYELERFDYLVYSNQTGFRPVSDTIFRTFVKTY
ncbi:MAG TPA: hypothetical protein VNI84_18960 [Pyrinomonadaceae bacterium]|nr:hypothetical protein [Pyrinomonadaceae bacterium]